MKIIESSLVTPILISIISLIIFVTINLFVNLYHDVEFKYDEVSTMYENGKENIIRVVDLIGGNEK